MQSKIKGVFPILLSILPLAGIYAQHTVKGCETIYGLEVIEWPLFAVEAGGQFINKGEVRFPGVTTLTNHGGFSESEQSGCTARYESPCSAATGSSLVVFDNSVEQTTINGSSPLRMFNVHNYRHLELLNELRILGTFRFNNGLVLTDRSNPQHFLHFMKDSQVEGQDAGRHVVGYAGWSGDGTFQLPLGDGFRLMPAAVIGVCGTVFKGAFFPVSPEQATLPAGAPFNPGNLGNGLLGVSESEYWDVDGSAATAITLHFDIYSDLSTYAGSLDEVVVAGWNGIQWVSLGNAGQSGSLLSGSVTSEMVIPDNFMAFTFGFVENQAFTPANLRGGNPASIPAAGAKVAENSRLALFQNRPNPFRTLTTIGYYVPEDCEITMRFYEVGGKLIHQQKEWAEAGYHDMEVNLANYVGSGMLYYELVSPLGSLTRKMILSKE